MEVELPSDGCNIISSATSFYNYASNNRTRSTYIIYEGKALLQSTTTSNTGYTYTGNCLTTGDLVYRPELKVYFPVISLLMCLVVFFIIYRVIIKRLLP